MTGPAGMSSRPGSGTPGAGSMWRGGPGKVGVPLGKGSLRSGQTLQQPSWAGQGGVPAGQGEVQGQLEAQAGPSSWTFRVASRRCDWTRRVEVARGSSGLGAPESPQIPGHLKTQAVMSRTEVQSVSGHPQGAPGLSSQIWSLQPLAQPPRSHLDRHSCLYQGWAPSPWP